MSMWLDKRPAPNPDNAWRVIGGELFVVVPGNRLQCTANGVGTRIWELADGSRTLNDIVDCLLDEYDVDRPTCETDLRSFMDSLEGDGLIVYEPAQQPVPGPSDGA